MSTARLKFLGANHVVTGSKYLVSLDETEMLFDCGMFQGLKELRLRNWSPPPLDPARLNAVALSHAHVDHSGYLPCLVRHGYSGPIYATPATCDLLGLLLPDTAHLMMEEAEFANRVGSSKHRPALPLFDIDNANRALKLLRPVKYGERVEIGRGLAFSYRNAGHILGSAITRFEVGERTLAFTGDLGRYGRPILKDPAPLEFADTLVAESTYGDRLHDRDDIDQLASTIRETAESGGCLLVPAFAVGRTQELIYYIRQLEESGTIPSLPVHMDSPMAIDATAIYARHHEEHNLSMTAKENDGRNPLRTRNFFIHRSPQESKTLNQMSGPMIIISASGMATGGRILHHLKLRLPRPETTVLMVGYQAQGTRGHSLQEGAQAVKMFGQWVPVHAKIKTIGGLSAHADQAEMMRWLGGFQRAPRHVYITHGEDKGAFGLKAKIESVLGWRCSVPDYLDEVAL
ncbi:MAG: MBL fold metallo-hydrolase [Candidatus Binataceae bacterium]|jgi:metallo-beta-lactamase family protein